MELTIEITQYCEHGCDYCSTNATKKGKHLPLKTIKEFLDKHESIGRINISGGEPLAHPKFYKILNYCKEITYNVWVYTNALDKIIYNTDVIQEIEVEANVCLVPNRDLYIPKNVQKTHLLQLIPQGRAKNMKAGRYHVSSNITMHADVSHGHNCFTCKHAVLQANGKTVTAPCKKEY